MNNIPKWAEDIYWSTLEIPLVGEIISERLIMDDYYEMASQLVGEWLEKQNGK